jgi:hypothetical protein
MAKAQCDFRYREHAKLLEMVAFLFVRLVLLATLGLAVCLEHAGTATAGKTEDPMGAQHLQS